MSEGSAPPGDGGDSNFRDPDALYERVKKDLGDMLSTPNNTAIVLQVLRDLDLNPGVARVIAAEAMKRLTSQELDLLNQDRQLQAQRRHTVLWIIVILAFAIVLTGTFGAIFYSLVYGKTENHTVTQQILLTMFTTSVAFLSGLFTPSPMSGGGSSNAEAFSLARYAMEQARPKPLAP